MFISSLPVSPAHHSSLNPRWLLLTCISGNVSPYSKLHKPVTPCSRANPKDLQQPRALGCICVIPRLRSISTIAVLVSSTLSQPEWTKDKELPVETDHKTLEVIQEALQNIRCNSLTRVCYKNTPAIAACSQCYSCFLPSLLQVGLLLLKPLHLLLCEMLCAFLPIHSEMLGQQSNPRQARCKGGGTDTRCGTVSIKEHD